MTKQQAIDGIMSEIERTKQARDVSMEIETSVGFQLQLEFQAQLDGLKIALAYIKAIDE